MQKFLEKVVAHGAMYGLDLNWDKTVVMPVKHDGQLTRPDGHVVRCVEDAVYLGGLLTGDGNPATELSRRIG